MPPAASRRLKARTASVRSSVKGWMTIAMKDSVRLGAPFAAQHGQNLLDAVHLVNFFGIELEIEFLFERQHQVQVMDRIPGGNVLAGRLFGNLAGRNLQHVGGDGANPVEQGRSQFLSPFMM